MAKSGKTKSCFKTHFYQINVKLLIFANLGNMQEFLRLCHKNNKRLMSLYKSKSIEESIKIAKQQLLYFIFSLTAYRMLLVLWRQQHDQHLHVDKRFPEADICKH